jgi:hypothetical protein
MEKMLYLSVAFSAPDRLRSEYLVFGASAASERGEIVVGWGMEASFAA